ncbi:MULTISPECIES: J domain-containing protein [Pseudoalteromonas]|uniref:J domain-containing protein n=1 Tax=Pseudoalteromonas luteoviolacea (strain 2ta16) TaxID=1353533 RepID=V4JC25_PSEL2|nr:MULTISPECIES: J domain-containing protein [Pseudoalteromonas]ESP92677.1 hypothetical protein PL2TA16_03875 [Pseudoalteromonas luteoviolacea 2ta16]KZN35487.1 hypothetical protein N483_00615 [Pseudoalteromonas luteoviolacea NCIMB 1944]MCG7546542.1 J domain-containing protein [Pseudoalteromonas sp. Of7M-16]
MSKDPWNVLELTPTSDKQQIEAAYQQKLEDLKTSPEETRAEQETQLNAAYQSVISGLAEPFTPSQQSIANPLFSEFSEELNELLGNAHRHTQVSAWQLLIDHPACQEIELRQDLAALIFDRVLAHQKSCQNDKEMVTSEVLIFLTTQLEWTKRDDLKARYGDNFYYRMTQQEIPQPEIIPEPIADTGNLANIFIGLTIICAIGLIMISV